MEDRKVVELEKRIKVLEEMLTNIKFEATEVTISGGHFEQIQAGSESHITINQSNCSLHAKENSQFTFHHSNVGMAAHSEFIELEIQLDELEDQFSDSDNEETKEKLAQVEEARDMLEEAKNLFDEGDDLLQQAKNSVEDLED